MNHHLLNFSILQSPIWIKLFLIAYVVFFCKHDADPTRLISPELVDYKRGLIEKSLRRAESGKLGGLRSAETRVKDQAILQSAAQAKVEESTAELQRKKASRG